MPAPKARQYNDDGFLCCHQCRGQDLGTTRGALSRAIEAEMLDMVGLCGPALQHYVLKTQTDTYTQVWTWTPG